MNLKLVIEYVGTPYHGWQRQPHHATLQGILEECIRTISGEKIDLIGAGRTDAGVHALGQVANFKTGSKLKAESWRNALNALLPKDISVLEVRPVADQFHARRSAKWKIYEYRILNRVTPSAHLYQRVWHLPVSLNLRAMRSAIRPILGEHDFSAFGAKSAQARHTRAHIKRLSMEKNDDLIRITLQGTNFLQYMVRNIVGTLVWVGLRKIAPSGIGPILGSRDRGRAGPTAPPHGLFLVQVGY